MSMRRYLLHIGYCGSMLRGVQKQREEHEALFVSVGGLVEKGLKRLRPESIEQLYFSSRTDTGVHAVCNTAHVDLSCQGEGLCYEPSTVTNTLNRFFKKINAEIRVHKTTLVPSTFHARYDAVSRKYLYRLAVTPEPASSARAVLEQFMPVAEIGKLYLVRPPFDAERLESVCRLLEGVHDFASFANVQSKGSIPRETLREIKSITVTPGQPLLDPTLDPLYSKLQFWDVTVHGKSFLYRQVRRTVGVLVGVAQRCLNLEDVQHLLDHPSQRNWNSKATVAPPDGLFLLDVEYPPHVFAEEGDDSGQSPQE
ncbi:tRNA pseudouridine synthase-like 1 [Portunus trituberculatus]|uniref:tRNA pseudouridine synthase-like 1 n=1 Tax=Portunus trituberculatus TaxID=210409 RepID=UPI001E1CEAB1|nr:tRNA pseudouridine synthase-like 1 [Portunus trituberculatus]XP_045120509.1 tRNA pseudouridine synthase-like 1 [Portunus trituberculatus]XP_045120510.1 tRNA pseudouridine synthase-like 1 [Portunus trituberculatus]XP_045120511.1 tRNA pseudouridine synthase-like 1 [Portunus trituberculatus]XP_045120513.1 tRNA pseudouridine synthase-like 1 [Portunus trituberculatus]